MFGSGMMSLSKFWQRAKRLWDCAKPLFGTFELLRRAFRLLVRAQPLFRLYGREPIPLGVPLLTAVLFLLTPQLADMLAAISGGHDDAGYNEAWWHQLGFGVATLALSFQSWFWMRAALNAGARRAGWAQPKAMPWAELLAPRLTVVVAVLIGISPAVLAFNDALPLQDVPWIGVTIAVVSTGIFIGLLMRRRRNALKLGGSDDTSNTSRFRVRRLFIGAPFSPVLACVIVVLAAIGIAIPQCAPNVVNDLLHTITAALLAMACLVAILTVLLALLRDGMELLGHWLSGEKGQLRRAWRGAVAPGPAPHSRAADIAGLILLLMLPVIGGYVFEQLGNYNIPTVGTAKPLRPKLGTAATAFQACHPDKPPIIVVIEGGASRSAAWGLSVMRMLDAVTGDRFSEQVFALSTVSGGSMAAVTYGMLRKQAAAAYVPVWDSGARGLIELSRADLLPAVVARMLTVDVITGNPTRASALANAFEHHWQFFSGFDLPPAAFGSFLGLQTGAPCLPHLVLNGTDVRTGSRVLTSTIALDPAAPDPALHAFEPQYVTDSLDLIFELGRDVSAATAVLNSARFPIVSPPGRLARGDRSSERPEVVDGGVFEGYGAQTGHELALGLRSRGMVPIMVVIRNDGARKTDQPFDPCLVTLKLEVDERRALAIAAGTQRGIWMPEFLSSLLGLNAARGAHGRAELASLRRDFCPEHHYFEFDMPGVKDGHPGVPMNWVLDARNCATLLGSARRSVQNRAQALALAVRLGVSEPSAETIDSLPEAGRCRI